MAIELTNQAIIERCEEWLSLAQQEQWGDNDEAVMKIANALLHSASLVLDDMKFLDMMGNAGLGHRAGPQVRRLLEISTVAWDMQAHEDETIADAVFAAWEASRSLPPKRVRQSRKRIKGENGQAAITIQRCWDAYNSESHFNLGERVAPAGGAVVVRQGIAMGYMVINAMALHREKYLAHERRTEATETAGALVDECGMALLREASSP